jgi:hypothetical protein
MIDANNWVAQADAVLKSGMSIHKASEKIAFATSFLAAIYGPESVQMKVFRQGADNIERRKDGIAHHLELHAIGTIRTTKAAVENGLVKTVRTQLSGEIMGDLLSTARDILQETTEASTHVGAVLVAAAFEDLMRRMAQELAGLTTRPKLETVVTELKDKQILKGGEIPTALAYLKFRNDSLHAHWVNVERSQVMSCLAFIEQLLTKHFSG